jgi:hypothetical protein
MDVRFGVGQKLILTSTHKVEWMADTGIKRLDAIEARRGATVLLEVLRSDAHTFRQQCHCRVWLVMTPSSLFARASLPSPGMPDILRVAPDVSHPLSRGCCSARRQHGLFLA